jgi:hypothetical protein
MHHPCNVHEVAVVVVVKPDIFRLRSTLCVQYIVQVYSVNGVFKSQYRVEPLLLYTLDDIN